MNHTDTMILKKKFFVLIIYIRNLKFSFNDDKFKLFRFI